VRNILDFPAEFPGTTVVTLETNYRSTQPILDVTNRIIGLSPKRHAKELRSVKGNGPKPALITCEREEDQTDFVVEKVLEHNESGLGLRRQAILAVGEQYRTLIFDRVRVNLTRALSSRRSQSLRHPGGNAHKDGSAAQSGCIRHRFHGDAREPARPPQR
jgi:superfamily I DNA/RNA helicase